jgi:hypothetical protein
LLASEAADKTSRWAASTPEATHISRSPSRSSCLCSRPAPDVRLQATVRPHRPPHRSSPSRPPHHPPPPQQHPRQAPPAPLRPGCRSTSKPTSLPASARHRLGSAPAHVRASSGTSTSSRRPQGPRCSTKAPPSSSAPSRASSMAASTGTPRSRDDPPLPLEGRL